MCEVEADQTLDLATALQMPNLSQDIVQLGSGV